MDIKLFSLGKQELPESESGKKAVSECVKCFFPDCGGFTAFTSQKRMLLAVSQSLRAADIVIIAVQNNMYNATKRMLSSALGLKTSVNEDVAVALKPLLHSGKIKENVYDSNVRFPVGAEIMMTESALTSGFAISSGAQHIIYLPDSSPRADEVVLGSLYDYLSEICEGMPARAAETRHRNIFKKFSEKFIEEKTRVACAGSPAVSLISRYLPKDDKGYIIADAKFDYAADDNETLISKARELLSLKNTQFSVIFGDKAIDAETQNEFLPVAIADEAGTSTVKLFKETDESDEEFTSACFDKILLMLCNTNQFTCADSDEDCDTKADKLLRSSLIRLTCAVIGGASAISLIIALIMG